MVKALDIKRNFLGIERQYSAFETSKVVILPAPYEHTVSYGTGTRNGPDAILKASRQVEYFDEETKREIFRDMVLQLSHLLFSKKKNDETALQLLYNTVFELVERQKFVVTLGGEHSISSSVIAAHAKMYPDLSVLQFDAHSDLRPEYLGNQYAMHRSWREYANSSIRASLCRSAFARNVKKKRNLFAIMASIHFMHTTYAAAITQKY